MANDKQSFTLKCQDANFMQRQKNVFDQLKVLENTRKTSSVDNTAMDVDNSSREGSSSSNRNTKCYRGKESIFKKPQDPSSRNFWKKMPDFKKNPHKWTKYSLDDVRDEDISDRSNTKAALSFLKELENRKKDNNQSEDSNQTRSEKIVFKRRIPSTKKEIEQSNDDDNKASFRSSKLVMPEYVVGQKKQKEKKNKSLKKDKGKELRLDHLMDEEESEET